MPIDTRIPLGVQRIRAPDQMQALGNVLAIQNAQQQNALAQYQMDRGMREDARSAALRNALAEAAGDPTKTRQAIASTGDVESLMTFDKSQASIAASNAEQEANRLKALGQKIALGAQLLGNVTDQASYEQALQIAADQIGMDALKGAPANYDPAWVKRTMMSALTMKDRIAAQLEGQKFDETKRHNRATEATAQLRAQNAGPLAMTIGPDGTQTIIGGPNGINPNAMGAVANARGSIKRAEKEGGQVGGYFGDKYVEILRANDAAQLEDAKLDRLDQLLTGIETGKLKASTNEIKRLAKTAGVDLEALGITDDVAPVEAARALSGELALSAVQAAKLTPVSNTDLQYISSLQPGIETTPDGRKLIIQTRKAMNKRAREVAKMAVQYRKEKGHLDEDFDAMLMDYAEQNPLFHAVSDDASFNAVPSGQFFVAPDGTVRRKP